MAPTITGLTAIDLRFPTSISRGGSDAMNTDPDYSAAYVVLTTSTGVEGHGFTFTIGRGNELCVAAIEAMRALVVGLSLETIVADMAGFWRSLAGDSQLRWVGPEKGVVHLALAAIVNAVWDLWAVVEGKAVWKLVADLTPQQFVGLIDFRHIADEMTPSQALALLERQAEGKAERETRLLRDGYPAYTTSAGWLGYNDERIRDLCHAAVAEGWSALKIKVGRNRDDDIRRCAVVRAAIGPDRLMMIDANQVWEVDEAIDWVRALARFDPYWIEEPVSPDDILGHARIAAAVHPVRVASGEHAHNRVMFKQFLQARALDVVQLDNCRLGGLNEVLAVRIAQPDTHELDRLATTLNRMLERLDAGFERERRFTNDASHEFRAPLSIILAEADLALSVERPAAQYKRALETIAIEAEAMERLTRDLLSTARRRNDDANETAPVDLGEIAEAAGSRLRILAERRGIVMDTDVGAESGIAAHADAIEQAVVTVVHNAIKYATSRCIVSVRRDSATSVEVRVSDDGPGFSASALEHAFDRFWRESGSDRNNGGHGLGLPIARSIVERFHGSIAIANSSAGGAIVSMRFPALNISGR